MTTDKECNSIAKEVYRVDSSKVDNPIKDRDTLASGKYKILKTEDNLDNGMQAMAIAPIKGGEVGKSHIMIVYVKSSYWLAS
ncbi:TPA: hypothetical protein TVG97_001929 [Streptococcus equi subsp. zooepidemicus]|nr:hypothetical protein [Streptococcus equi subsp. zooepidemicus]HEL1129666.1 hypothetical protein [Streptococcus equi subsp. zooepidemicus]